jgi:ketosteroid isomerase-like protein
MRIPFDRRTVPGIPLTRMPGSMTARLSAVCRRQPKAVWAIVMALALGTCAIPIHAGMPLAQKHETRHEIDQLEDEWREATLNSDTKTMDSLLSDDYMAITASGTVEDKEQTLARLKSGVRHVSSLTISERKVRFYEKTAVVTSLVDIQGTGAEGNDISGSYRYTRVYVQNAQGAWKIVSFEASRIREPGPKVRMKALR